MLKFFLREASFHNSSSTNLLHSNKSHIVLNQISIDKDFETLSHQYDHINHSSKRRSSNLVQTTQWPKSPQEKNRSLKFQIKQSLTMKVPKKPQNSNLKRLVRRKSCYCQDCGGVSKLEVKTRNIVLHSEKEEEMEPLFNVKINEIEKITKAISYSLQDIPESLLKPVNQPLRSSRVFTHVFEPQSLHNFLAGIKSKRGSLQLVKSPSSFPIVFPSSTKEEKTQSVLKSRNKEKNNFPKNISFDKLFLLHLDHANLSTDNPYYKTQTELTGFGSTCNKAKHFDQPKIKSTLLNRNISLPSQTFTIFGRTNQSSTSKSNKTSFKIKTLKKLSRRNNSIEKASLSATVYKDIRVERTHTEENLKKFIPISSSKSQQESPGSSFRRKDFLAGVKQGIKRIYLRQHLETEECKKRGMLSLESFSAKHSNHITSLTSLSGSVTISLLKKVQKKRINKDAISPKETEITEFNEKKVLHVKQNQKIIEPEKRLKMKKKKKIQSIQKIIKCMD